MFANYFEFSHNTLGMHFYDLPTIILVLILVTCWLVHNSNQKKREDAFEKEMEEAKDNDIKDTEEATMASPVQQ